MKKIVMLFLSVLLLVALAVTTNAAEEEPTEKEAIIQEARRVYYYSRSTAGKSSFAGFCGLMTSHQLYHMGINDSIIVNDGNRQFDYYAAREVTTGGYYINAYPATEYTLTEALNTITRDGTKDAYNLLVGFQWTNTEAGGRYGHACVINAIVDGTVYFVESFHTSIAGREGNVGQCSIERFAELFSGWTSFEGVIDFGTGQYADACETYETSLYIRTRFETTLRSQPCLLGQQDSYAMRQVKAGELLQVSAICKDRDTGMAYYRVEEVEGIGYISAGAAYHSQLADEDCLMLLDAEIPAYQKPNRSLKLSGTVSAEKTHIGEIEVVVTDLEDQVLVCERQNVDGYEQSLAALNKQLASCKLEKGFYRVQVYGSAVCKYVAGTDVETTYVRQLLHEQVFQVNDTPFNTRICYYQEEETEQVKDGWVVKGGTIYRYKMGSPQTGWFEEYGIYYYLDENGAVTTGWQEIDCIKYYFTASGARYIGWLTTADGIMYLSETDGQAMGWQVIDGNKYYFKKNGLLVTKGVVKDGKKRYEIQENGQAVLIKDNK